MSVQSGGLNASPVLVLQAGSVVVSRCLRESAIGCVQGASVTSAQCGATEGGCGVGAVCQDK
jgi:hypothetical protein